MKELQRFGRFEVRAFQRQLLVDGQPVAIGARAFDLLLALLERPGELLTKNDLLDAVWPDLAVEESNLTVQVSTLRKLLGAGVIATIPGRGYRFVATTSQAPSAEPGTGAMHAGLRTNLPIELQPLIGRDDDVEALGSLLAQHRLVTITGAGGMGKTRLAERLVHERRDAFEHGVSWIELAALTDSALLPGTIAAALGLQTGAGDPLDGLAGALSPLHVLVALDNAEHLIEPLSNLIQVLLVRAPRLSILVTSQMSLRLQGERVYRLGPLAMPDTDEALDAALGYGAVQLFVERARAADRTFVVNAQTLPSILQICAQLDGVALALELAAARVPTLGVTALALSLDERLRLLTQGRRDMPVRQQTLRSALEWSHALLAAPEADVFRRLSVFAGGFTLEAARRVVAVDGDGDDWTVVDALCTLVDRSLVDVGEGAAPRYRLLESARAFALERLAASDEEATLRERHAQVVTRQFVELALDSLQGRCGVDDALAQLSPDLDNARAALAWFMAHDDAEGAVRLAPPLSFALTIARHAERSRLWDVTTPLVRDDLSAETRAAWAASCSGHWYWRKPAVATHWARIAVQLYRELGDDRGLYRSLSMLGMATARGDLRDECEQACAELQAFDQRGMSARAQFMASVAHLGLADRRGDVVAMRQILQRQLTLAKAAGDTSNVQNTLSTLADTDLVAGRIADSVAHGVELERRLSGTRHQNTLAFVRVGLTGALIANDDHDAARDMALRAWPLAVRFDIKSALADNLALLCAKEGRASSAAMLLGYADAGNAASGLVRQLSEAHAAQQAEALARPPLGDTDFERLRSRGAALHDDEALAIALATTDGSAA